MWCTYTFALQQCRSIFVCSSSLVVEVWTTFFVLTIQSASWQAPQAFQEVASCSNSTVWSSMDRLLPALDDEEFFVVEGSGVAGSPGV